jgi:hypothetical protein
MSRYQPYRGPQRHRYQVVMKKWRRLRESDPDQPIQQRRARRRLLEELRVLELETVDSAWQ